MELQESLPAVGATVLRPYCYQNAALQVIEQTTPDCELVDFNLDTGNSLRWLRG